MVVPSTIHSLKNGNTIFFTPIGPRIQSMTTHASNRAAIEKILYLSLANPVIPKPTEATGNKYTTIPTGY